MDLRGQIGNVFVGIDLVNEGKFDFFVVQLPSYTSSTRMVLICTATVKHYFKKNDLR